MRLLAQPQVWMPAILMVRGAIDAYITRQSGNPDGLCYLGVSDAYLDGAWDAAWNPLWSPLYPWLLGLAIAIVRPEASFELPLVHIVNFFAFVFALACFHAFWRSYLDWCLPQQKGVRETRWTTRSWLWLLGYILFATPCLDWIRIELITPDLLAFGFLLLMGRQLIRIQLGGSQFRSYATLGALVGLGYLAKSPLLYIGLLIIAISLLPLTRKRAISARAAAAFGCLLLVAGPYVVALSAATGRWTTGEAGRLNYLWHVNTLPHLLSSEPIAGHGTPVHPVRRILERPAIYDSRKPNAGAYTAGCQRTYWYEGYHPAFNLQQQLPILWRHVKVYFTLLREQKILVAFLLVLMWVVPRPLEFQFRRSPLVLLIPAVFGFAMFMVIHVELRYIAGVAVLGWAGLLAPCVSNLGEAGRRVFPSLVAIVALAFGLSGWAQWAVDSYRYAAQPQRLDVRIANELTDLGVTPGSTVGSVGRCPDCFWARFAGLSIVAELQDPAGEWARPADASQWQPALNAFQGLGLSAVVAPGSGGTLPSSGWQALGSTGHYVYIFPDQIP